MFLSAQNASLLVQGEWINSYQTGFFVSNWISISFQAVLLEKLKYAIHFCKSIDTDEYARVAMGEPTEATGSEDNSDLESVASHEG